MGDLIGSIFGGAQGQTEERTVDPMTEQLNRLKLQQAQQYFRGQGMGAEFMQPGGAAYAPSPAVQDLFNQAQGAYGQAAQRLNAIPQMGQFNLGDYQNLGLNTAAQNYANAFRDQGNVLGAALNQAQGGLDQAQASAFNALGTGRGFNQQDYQGLLSQQVGDLQSGRARAMQDYTGLMGQQAADLQGALGRNNAYYSQLYNQMAGLGFDQARNYVSQVATPQLMQTLALQGLEGGGAAPAAIARASAEAGMPVFQALAGLGQQYQGLQGQAGQQYTAGNQALNQALQQGNLALDQRFMAGNQALNQALQQGNMGLAQQYAGNLAQAQNLASQQQAQAYLQNAGNLAGLAGQYGQGQLGFIQGLPQAYTSTGLAPIQAATGVAQATSGLGQAATQLFPLADYSRQLQESSLNRRQGLYGSMMTGLPYTPGGTVETSKQQPSIFSNITGIGSPTGFFGKGTGFL